MSFIHLHRHSEFSRLDGIGTAKQYADRAAELGQPALAQTDHGTLSGALHHIVACQAAGIVPISGVEAYFRPDRLKAKQEKNQKAWHLCLFAKNLKGWHNLLGLVSTAYAEVEDGGGFYQVPCVDWELLERYHEGLVCSTACISSWLANLVDLGHDREVYEYIARMRKLFGDDLWIEIMPHDFDDQRILNKNLVAVAQEFSIPVIATNDAHFPYKEWADTHRIAKMMGSQSSFASVAEAIEKGKKPDYLAEINPTLYIATEQEMKSWFRDHHPDIASSVVDEAMSNTMLFARSIKPFLLDKKVKLPKVTESIEHTIDIMENWIKEGLDNLVRTWIQEDGLNVFAAAARRKEYQKRVDTEWKVLIDKGVLDYFVMVGQIVRWCATTDPLPPCAPGERDQYPEHREEGYQKKPIRVGLGRGSAAGCLISYLVGIVKIDPIAYGLLFERFLNPNRKGLPDIDMDFQSGDRALVKEFISRLYGRDHVADIITHQRFQPKKVLADLARAYDIHYLEARKLTKPIDIRQDSEETTLEEILPLYPHLQKFVEEHEHGKAIWKHGLRLERTVANAGKHAAGIVITPKPIWNYMALERGKTGDLVTSWSDAADFSIISDYGFVKLDALGIKGLEIHDYACRLIEERTGVKVDLYALPALRDPYRVEPEVMNNYTLGRTVKVFQFASPGITRLIKSTRPENILDLASVNALYRPGPMKSGVTWEFPRRKNNPFMRQFQHPDLKEWLGETYGLIAYQEQVMQISSGIGRMSGADADDMRKAMGKLYRIKGGTAAKDFMGKYEKPFFDGAVEDHGWDGKVAEAVWNMFLEFGHYGFNKSHSCSYALQSYQDMWLKTHYPHEFYAAALTFEEDEDTIKAIVREARSIGIDLHPPDLNTSTEHYSTDGESLRLGLTAIKGMGTKTAKDAIKLRPFESIEDLFVRGKGLPHRQIIESGAVDSLADREYLLSVVTKVKRSGDNETWMVWEHIKHNTTLKKPRPVPKFRRAPSQDLMIALREASFAIPIKESKIDEFAANWIRENCHLGDEFSELREKERAVVGGEIVKVDFKLTKNNKQYANVRIAFESDQWMCKLWEEKMLDYEDLLVVGKEVMAVGKKNIWNDFESIVVEEMVEMAEFMADDDTMEEAA